ncbi:MAG: hypothetical protein K2J07_04840, partial [Muribaculaceae bacterium]|nr:hypothetical protein [Muribaculaceae bacterium]
MMKNYFSRAALLLGAAAFIGASANAEETKGAWRNVNHLLTNVAGVNAGQTNGWSGIVTGSSDAIAEIFQGAGLFYYVVPDAPAGEYTFTAQAFTRVWSAPEAYQLRKDGKEDINCYVFLNDTEVKMKSLFDGTDQDLMDAEGNYVWGLVPNSLGEARTFFDAKKYTNTVTVNHPGGDLYLGFRNYGTNLDFSVIHFNGDYPEWTAFGDATLTGPNGAVTLPEIGGYDMEADWTLLNVQQDKKGRGIRYGAVWSKTNASMYQLGQTITLEPGKYRFALQGLNEHFLGSASGYCVPMKGAFADRTDLNPKSAYDLYFDGGTELGSGAVTGDQAWDPTTFYPVNALEAYLCFYYGTSRAGGFDEGSYVNYWPEEYEGKNLAGEEVSFPALAEGQWAQTKLKNVFDEKLDTYVQCNNYKDEDGDWVYTWIDEQGNAQPSWWESGCNFMVSKFFMENPDLYQNYVELEITGTEAQEVTFSWRKDVNQNNYWQCAFDVRLEKWDADYTGYVPGSEMAGIDEVADDEDANAPVEYYNLQGVRVQNPSNG